VFEPNDVLTRAKLHLSLTSFLLSLWQRGALMGTAAEASSSSVMKKTIRQLSANRAGCWQWLASRRRNLLSSSFSELGGQQPIRDH
jgi:hypothetical protein